MHVVKAKTAQPQVVPNEQQRQAFRCLSHVAVDDRRIVLAQLVLRDLRMLRGNLIALMYKWPIRSNLEKWTKDSLAM